MYGFFGKLKLYRILAVVGLFALFFGGQIAAGFPEIELDAELPKQPQCDALLGDMEYRSTGLGPNFYYQNTLQTRNPEDLKSLKIASYNVFNLIKNKGKFNEDPETGKLIQVSPEIEKSPESLQEIANLIMKEQPDIIVLQEVDDSETLEKFTTEYLKDQYFDLLVEGNDPRGIEIGFLIKKNLPFDLEIQGHKHKKGQYQNENIEIFSRDLPIVTFWPQGSHRQGKPYFSIAGAHLKSMGDKKGDPQSTILRGQQVIQTLDVLKSYEQKYGDEHVKLLIGDFNTHVPEAAELQPLWEAGFREVFDLLENQLSEQERVTHSYHPIDQPPSYKQLDAFLFAPSLFPNRQLVLEAKVVPYLDSAGHPRPFPKTREERNLQASDHRMIVFEMDFSLIYDLLFRDKS